MKTNINFSCGFFAQCCALFQYSGWLLLSLLLSACGGSDSGTVSVLDEVNTSATHNWLQIVPAQRPDFDPSIHDYVIDCSSTTAVDITATAAALHGFVYLGSTANPKPVWPDQEAALRQTVQLKPGQGFRFYLQSGGIYSVRCLPPDFPPLTVSVTGTPQSQWYVFSPDLGNGGDGNYVIITDPHGTPVWWLQEAAQFIVDAKVLDSHHIAWARQNAPGSYYIRDFDGTVSNTLTYPDLDIHDLQLTSQGTYYAIRYVNRVCPPDCADMSQWGGSAQMSVTDAEIVELDSNSHLLWSWRTRDHIDLAETGDIAWFPGIGADIIHMNAVAPDGDDGVLFSARHLNAIYRIVKSTGAIDWKIGGVPRAESLTILNDSRPTATGFNTLSGQHDVRRWPDGTVSVHDNGTLVLRPPAVIRFQIDTTNRTANVVQTLSDSRVTGSGCCGSARLLDSGNWLVQWGAADYMTELDATGNPVLTINYNLGTTFSYRAVPVPTGMVTAATLRAGMDAIYAEP